MVSQRYHLPPAGLYVCPSTPARIVLGEPLKVFVSGFTFVRNAVHLDYPVLESIRSILPIVDEFVINVGASTDDTLELIRGLDSPKIRILCSEWNPHTNTGGYVYAQQTNIALFNCRGLWAFYLQGDEVVHEEDLPHLEAMMRQFASDPRVDALALEQIDFWGDYRTRFAVWPWLNTYRCRVVKPHHFILSRGDALGFTVHPKYKERGRCPRAVETRARLFHYCTLKSESAIRGKREAESQHWSERQINGDVTSQMYYQAVPRCFVGAYEGSHPAVMSTRIRNYPLNLNLNSTAWRTSLHGKERKIMRWHRLHQLVGGRGFRKGWYRRVGRAT